jgi:hypothetical protein
LHRAAGRPGGRTRGGALELGTARVREKQLHRSARLDLHHRELDDVVGRILLVGHLERLDELGSEVVALRLPRELLLEPHALGDVPRIHDDPADVPIAAQVGQMSLEIAPFAHDRENPEDQLLRATVALCALDGLAVVLVHVAQEAAAVEIGLRTAEQRDHRLADVAAAAVPEHEHEIGRRGDQTAEMRGLTSGRGDQRPGEKKREQQSADAEADLEQDEVVDVLVRAGRDRSHCVERDVRGQRRKDPEALNGVVRVDPLAARLGQVRDRLAREVCGARARQVVDEPHLLFELATDEGIGLGGQRRLVVVPVDRWGEAAVEERVGALGQHLARTDRIRLAAGLHEQHVADVTLGEHPLTGRDLDHGCAVLRASGHPDRHRRARGRDERERQHDRDRRPSRACAKWAEGGRHARHHDTTTVVCMPPR